MPSKSTVTVFVMITNTTSNLQSTVSVTVVLAYEDSCYDLLAKGMVLSAKRAKVKWIKLLLQKIET